MAQRQVGLTALSLPENRYRRIIRFPTPSNSLRSVMPIVVSVVLSLRSLVRSRAELHLEIFCPPTQLQILERSRRPRYLLTAADRLVWVGSRVSDRVETSDIPCTGHHLAWHRVGSACSGRGEPTPHGPTDGPARRPCVDPHDVSGESALGCASHPRRAAEARDRPESVHRAKYMVVAGAAVTDVADVPWKPRRPGVAADFLVVPSAISPAVRARILVPTNADASACRSHRTPYRGVEAQQLRNAFPTRNAQAICCTIATAPSTALPHPRGDADPRGGKRPTLALAERVVERLIDPFVANARSRDRLESAGLRQVMQITSRTTCVRARI